MCVIFLAAGAVVLATLHWLVSFKTSEVLNRARVNVLNLRSNAARDRRSIEKLERRVTEHHDVKQRAADVLVALQKVAVMPRPDVHSRGVMSVSGEAPYGTALVLGAEPPLIEQTYGVVTFFKCPVVRDGTTYFYWRLQE